MMHKDAEGHWVEAPIHAWFGLSRTNYFVMPRLAIQELPIDWQERFIVLMDEAENAGLRTPKYHVLREGRKYTEAQCWDEDDETSRYHEFIVIDEDPWADYRRGSATKLCDTFRREDA